jgi:putative nucleotidyltransferase with HDIG domain
MMSNETVSNTAGVVTHGALIRRLSLVTFLVALAISTAVYYLQEQRLLADVLDYAKQQVEVFSGQLTESEVVVSPSVLQREVEAFAARQARLRAGHFSIIRIGNPGDPSLAEIRSDMVAPTSLDVDELERWARALDRPTITQASRVEAGERLAFHVLVSLDDSISEYTSEGSAYVYGSFVVSEAKKRDLLSSARQATIFALAIVIVTTLVLYPAITSLMRQLTRFSSDLLESNLESLQLLGAAVAKRDTDTDAHNYRVTILAVRLGERTGMSRELMQGLIKGAFLHDIGKIAIRDEVLLKPGKLDDAEFEHMRSHVDHGVEILARSKWLEDARDVVAYHHEKFGGGGYGRGLSGTDIPIGARVFAIADVFDALTSKRPYKEPFSFEETVLIMTESSGSHFDPELLGFFFEIAEPIYNRMAQQSEEETKDELRTIINRYFTGTLNELT